MLTPVNITPGGPGAAPGAQPQPGQPQSQPITPPGARHRGKLLASSELLSTLELT